MSVCVNNLKRCKTSNLLEFRSSVPVLSLFIFCFSDLQGSGGHSWSHQESPLNEDTPSWLWYAIWTQIARTCTRYSNPPSLEPASRFHRFCFNQFYSITGGTSWHNSLAMAMATSQCFSGPLNGPFLSGVPGRFVHVTCIPQQNLQWQFWASVLLTSVRQDVLRPLDNTCLGNLFDPSTWSLHLHL